MPFFTFNVFIPFLGAEIALFFFWFGFPRRAAEVEKDEVCANATRLRDAIDPSEGRRDSRRTHIEEDMAEKRERRAHCSRNGG